MSGVGGIFGLALGYYALLWLDRSSIAAKKSIFWTSPITCRKAVLPSCFARKMKQPPALPHRKWPQISLRLRGCQTGAAKEVEPVARRLRATQRRKKAARSRREASGVYRASRSAREEVADPDDRYAIPARKSEPAMREPAPLDTPPAKAITENTSKVEPIRIVNAPSFTAADMQHRLAAANTAEAAW